MVSTAYSNAYSEILEILKYISKEDYEKIPKSKIKLFEMNCNKEYKFVYDSSKTLDEQNVSKITKQIIAILFRDYWATPKQKEIIINYQNNERIRIEKEKSEKYGSKECFSKNEKLTIESNVSEKNMSIVKYKQTFFTRFKHFIKEIIGMK